VRTDRAAVPARGQRPRRPVIARGSSGIVRGRSRDQRQSLRHQGGSRSFT
jgi:hypothetical protein